MGIRDERLKKLPYLEALGKGAKINPKDAQWLIIPNYKNLMAVGYLGDTGEEGGLLISYSRKCMIVDLTIVQRRGRLLFFFGDTPDAGGSHEIRHKHELNKAPLWVGEISHHTATVQFLGHLGRKRLPKVLQRGEKAIAKAVTTIEQGRVEYVRL